MEYDSSAYTLAAQQAGVLGRLARLSNPHGAILAAARANSIGSVIARLSQRYDLSQIYRISADITALTRAAGLGGVATISQFRLPPDVAEFASKMASVQQALSEHHVAFARRLPEPRSWAALPPPSACPDFTHEQLEQIAQRAAEIVRETIANDTPPESPQPRRIGFRQ